MDEEQQDEEDDDDNDEEEVEENESEEWEEDEDEAEDDEEDDDDEAGDAYDEMEAGVEDEMHGVEEDKRNDGLVVKGRHFEKTAEPPPRVQRPKTAPLPAEVMSHAREKTDELMRTIRGVEPRGAPELMGVDLRRGEEEERLKRMSALRDVASSLTVRVSGLANRGARVVAWGGEAGEGRGGEESPPHPGHIPENQQQQRATSPAKQVSVQSSPESSPDRRGARREREAASKRASSPESSSEDLSAVSARRGRDAQAPPAAEHRGGGINFFPDLEEDEENVDQVERERERVRKEGAALGLSSTRYFPPGDDDADSDRGVDVEESQEGRRIVDGAMINGEERQFEAEGEMERDVDIQEATMVRESRFGTSVTAKESALGYDGRPSRLLGGQVDEDGGHDSSLSWTIEEEEEEEDPYSLAHTLMSLHARAQAPRPPPLPPLSPPRETSTGTPSSPDRTRPGERAVVEALSGVMPAPEIDSLLDR